MDRDIRTADDVLRLLDGLFAPEADRWTANAGSSWWDSFYSDCSKPVPFFVAKPDENLVSYLDRNLITPGRRALDVGCGPGRNALHLASAGFTVAAVDLSPAAIAWAKDRARDADAEVQFHCGDAFALTATDLGGPYNLTYDSGCFHHLPPHRRISYLALLDRSLAPGGHLALTCFAAGEMGSELPDADFYRHSRLDGGLAYTPESLRWIFSHLTEVELRRMRDEPPESPRFGEPSSGRPCSATTPTASLRGTPQGLSERHRNAITRRRADADGTRASRPTSSHMASRPSHSTSHPHTGWSVRARARWRAGLVRRAVSAEDRKQPSSAASASASARS